IQQTLKGETADLGGQPSNINVDKRLDSLEEENKDLIEAIKNIQSNLSKLEARIAEIDISKEKPPATSSNNECFNDDQAKPKSKEEDDDDDSDDN
ncbi:hypothetical protein, partial [Salmonella sp. s54925]|uniref:hypothetical protein n=1 Tax=Salmonella sp. s54925 TaxID=3159674 RepID=UPI0039816283